jgi:hypothetical protein
METQTQNKRRRRVERSTSIGKYPSIEAASEAKMAKAAPFIANIDMSLFLKNGPLE